MASCIGHTQPRLTVQTIDPQALEQQGHSNVQMPYTVHFGIHQLALTGQRHSASSLVSARLPCASLTQVMGGYVDVD